MTNYFTTDYNDILKQISKYYYPYKLYYSDGYIYYSFNGTNFDEPTKDDILKDPSNLLKGSCFHSKEVNFEKFYIKVTSYDEAEKLVAYTLLVDTPFSKVGFNIENRIIALSDFNDFLNDSHYDFSIMPPFTYEDLYSKLVLTNVKGFETVIFKTGDNNLFPILNYYYSHTLGNDGRIFLNTYLNDEEKIKTEGKVGLLRNDGTFSFYPIELWEELIKYNKVFKYELLNPVIDNNILFNNFWRLVKEDIDFYNYFKDTIKFLYKREGNKYNYVYFLRNNLFYKIGNNDITNFIKFESNLINRISEITRNIKVDIRYKLDKYIRKAFRSILNNQIKYTLEEEKHEENE